jgi:tryptophanyl-tRNA synthetase
MARILSGIRPSGQLHLGNYLGAIKQWIELQDHNEVYYMVADLHAITTPFVAPSLRDEIRDTVLDYLAAGLDPKRSVIFVQSHIPAHSELMWLLNTITPIGELQRMVQFKEKSKQHADYQNAGILNYPILMAADILAYKAEQVPVGEDQVQHVEIARDIAKRFNRMFERLFPEPQPLLVPGKRIMDLYDPLKKMSKSLGGGIGLNDSSEIIADKLKGAVTSNEPRVIREAFAAAQAGQKSEPMEWKGDPNLQKQFHGVRNLFTILLTLGSAEEIATWKAAADNGVVQFSAFKPVLATIISEAFAPFREKRNKLASDKSYIDDVIVEGSKRAKVIADETLHEVQTRMGLR